MGHSHNCETEEKYFSGTLGADEYSGPDEYRIYVGKDVISFTDRPDKVFYSADICVGRRWADHIVISFHDESSDDKTKLLYGMRQLINDLQDAVDYLDSL